MSNIQELRQLLYFVDDDGLCSVFWTIDDIDKSGRIQKQLVHEGVVEQIDVDRLLIGKLATNERCLAGAAWAE